jgi:hypothetical protein
VNLRFLESIFAKPKIKKASDRYKYLSAERAYEGIRICKKGNNAKKKVQLRKNKSGNVFLNINR